MKHPSIIPALTIAMVIAFIAIFAMAQTYSPHNDLAARPVLHEGRIKPLDSYARILLRSMRGDEESAMIWMSGMISTPAAATKEKTFRIQSPQFKEMMGLEQNQKHFTALDLAGAFQGQEERIETLLKAPPEDITKDQQEYLSLYNNLLLFTLTLGGENIPFIPETDTSLPVQHLKLKTEVLYNALHPYRISITLYILAVLLSLWAIRRPNLYSQIAAFSALLGGVTIHILSIAARIFILSRPPVGTLYESVLFVSVICAIAALIIFTRQKNLLILIAGSLSASALLFLAPITAPQGEDLEVLAAVLNTNFWLATHVLCITIGYGLCILAAVLAHISLFQSATTTRESHISTIHRLSLYALFFSAIGTILGGIWADQSWGRFWGWDPKENGALLIVLWLIWAQHGRLSGHLNPRAFTAIIAYLGVIVALSWLGVNLLGVGLHSYGFTSGLAAGLAIFCATETILIAALLIAAHRNNKKAKLS